MNSPHNQATSGGNESRSLIPAGIFLALIVAAWIFPSTPAAGSILCPFRRLFDVICPGCGMTRSVMSLVRGDWLQSVAYHPAGPILVGGLGVVGGLRIGDRIAGRRLFGAVRGRFDRHSSRIWAVALAGLILLWGVRLFIGAGAV